MTEQPNDLNMVDAEGYEEILIGNLTLGIQVSPDFVGRVDTRRISGVVRQTIGTDRLEEKLELGLVIVDDAQIRDLNRQFRQVDSPTDVLAFAMMEGESPKLENRAPPVYLGDVIISFPRAESQARETGHPVEDEVDLLVVHGVLHLLGFDHGTESEKEEMWARQEAILGKRLVD